MKYSFDRLVGMKLCILREYLALNGNLLKLTWISKNKSDGQNTVRESHFLVQKCDTCSQNII